MTVEAGSFQAADRLRISQPALSRNIRKLEARIGAPVFDRSARRSVPTELGLRLGRNGLAIRIAGEEAESFCALVAECVAGKLRIGAPPIVAGRFLTDPLAHVLADRPECQIDLRVGLVHELRAMLERSQIDLVIGPKDLAGRMAGSRFTLVTDDRVGILCRADQTLRKDAILSALEAQSWIAHSRGSMLRQQTEGALIAMGLERVHVAVETDSIRSVFELVAATDLISTMPRVTTAPYLGRRQTFLDLDHERLHRPLGRIERADRPENGVGDAFVKQLMGADPKVTLVDPVATRPHDA